MQINYLCIDRACLKDVSTCFRNGLLGWNVFFAFSQTGAQRPYKQRRAEFRSDELRDPICRRVSSSRVEKVLGQVQEAVALRRL